MRENGVDSPLAILVWEAVLKRESLILVMKYQR